VNESSHLKASLGQPQGLYLSALRMIVHVKPDTSRDTACWQGTFSLQRAQTHYCTTSERSKLARQSKHSQQTGLKAREFGVHDPDASSWCPGAGFQHSGNKGRTCSVVSPALLPSPVKRSGPFRSQCPSALMPLPDAHPCTPCCCWHVLARCSCLPPHPHHTPLSLLPPHHFFGCTLLLPVTYSSQCLWLRCARLGSGAILLRYVVRCSSSLSVCRVRWAFLKGRMTRPFCLFMM
jgi:hypothetical protein